MDSKPLTAICAESGERAEPPTVEELEALFRTLANHRERLRERPQASSSLPSDDEIALVEQLLSLKLGPAPPELHERVKREWLIVQDAWASNVTLRAFEEQMIKLLTPLGDAASEIQQIEKELSQQQECLETLRTLAELLDELTEYAPQSAIPSATQATTLLTTTDTPGAKGD